MKQNTLALAVCAALGALAASSAGATQLVASNYSAATTQDFYLSGATAQDSGILQQMRSLCKVDTPAAGTVNAISSLVQYQILNTGATTTNTNLNVYFCEPDIGTGTGQINLSTAGGINKMAVYKYSIGGSGAGVQPVNDGSSLAFLDLTKIAALGSACATATPDFNDSSLPSYRKFVCNQGTNSAQTNQPTKIGFSDVDPGFFADAAHTANLTANITGVSSLVFGVPVTRQVRDHMQAQQGLVVGDDSAANMPSLSSAQLTTLYTQAGQTWSAIGVNVTNTLAASGTSPALVALDDNVYVARRVNSSGTQKTFEALVAGAPNGDSLFKSCNSSTDLFVSSSLGNDVAGDAATACSTSPQTVFSGSGGGDVRNCLIAHNSANRGAIGILTTEDKPGSNGWRFVAVDGVIPTGYNVALGKYRLYTENTFQYLTATNSGNYAALITALKRDFANSTILNIIDAGLAQTFGRGGLMGLASNGGAGIPLPTSEVAFNASPINPFTKIGGTLGLDNCQKPKLFN